MNNIFLETDRLILRRLEESDFPDYAAYAVDNEMSRMMGRPILKTEADIRTNFGWLKDKEPRCYGIVEKNGGHLIGTHSYEHVNLSNLSDAAAIEQVDKTNAAIYDITGKYPEYIRPPYGCWKCNLDYETKMIEVLWDVDPKDWATDNSGVIAKRVIDKVGENDIILLHDASESSVKAAFAIIDELGKEGYTFVTVEEILME